MEYAYEALESTSHIRLLTITPRNQIQSTDDSISILLEQYPIQKCPKYQALSYTWGGTVRPNHICLPSQARINVTANVHAALVRLRTASTPVVLWIDAICINQDDVAERSSQVALMKQIYQSATRVIVWLPTISGAPEPSKCVVVQKPGIEDYYKDDQGQWARRPRAQEDYSVIEIPSDVMQLFSHPWFTRIWILQEAVYAKRVLIRTGQSTFYWDDVLDWVSKYFNRATDPRNTPCADSTELHMAMLSLIENWRTEIATNTFDLTFSQIFDHAIFCEATEVKDKVFALLSLAGDVDEQFKPNYLWTEAEIATKVTRCTIETTNTLDILRCIGSRGGTNGDKASQPSWIPQLFGDIECRALPPHSRRSSAQHADRGDQTQLCKLRETAGLEVKALRVLSVEQVEKTKATWTEEGNSYRLFETMNNWYNAVQDHEDYNEMPSTERINAFWGTMRMTLGSEATEQHIHNAYERGEGWQWHFRKLFVDTDRDIGGDIGDSQPEDPYNVDNEMDDIDLFDPDQPELYSSWAKDVLFPAEDLRHIPGRAFGFTTQGHMALLPADTQKRDEIVLLYGIRLPFILRWQWSSSSYHIIGPCYVHQKFHWDLFESADSWDQMQWIRIE